MSQPIPFNRTLHCLALTTAIATFPLIFVGGLVTSKQAGLSVPDWPNSFGYNMFLFPPRLWLGGILYEHTHRLGGTMVGLLSLCLCGYAWWGPNRSTRSIRLLATAVLIGVVLQGVLGGLRVRLVNVDLAMAHACVAQAFFCLVAVMALVTSRFWSTTAKANDPIELRPGRQLILIAGATALLIYFQLIIAAVMRHSGAGLAVPDIPLIYGKWLPPTQDAQLQAINAFRVRKLNLPPVTLNQIWLHAAHRMGAVVVSAAVGATVAHVLYWHRRQRAMTLTALFLGVLILMQVTLGLATVYFRKPADIASAHVAVGALVLMACVVLMFQAIRFYAPDHWIIGTSDDRVFAAGAREAVPSA